MKIGILTFHRAHNYGAVLQCFALQEFLKKMGHDVQVIDYRQPYIEKKYSVFSLKYLFRLLLHPVGLLHYIKYEMPQKKKVRRNFYFFCKTYLQICKEVNTIPNDLDAYIVGSDQVWSINCLGGVHDEVYFGNFEHKKGSKIIGYSISTNLRSLEFIGSERLISLIRNFDRLALREEKLAFLLKEKIGSNISVTLDPTLLTTEETWDSLINTSWKERDYVLVYYVTRPIGNYPYRIMLEKAKILAEQYGFELVDLSKMDYSVSDFVSAFKYAKCVITSSFHATVFSLLFKRPIYPIKLHDGQDDRYTELMRNLSLEKYVAELDDDFSRIPEVNYSSVDILLKSLRDSSESFIQNSLL